jgi:glycosyltransferase involved in cell wall biosynthesis
MAVGLPAISTDVGDIKSIVAASNRPYIVPLKDEAALTGALRSLIRLPALRAQIGADNRAKAESQFGVDQMIAAYDRLFETTARGW